LRRWRQLWSGRQKCWGVTTDLCGAGTPARDAVSESPRPLVSLSEKDHVRVSTTLQAQLGFWRFLRPMADVKNLDFAVGFADLIVDEKRAVQ
jgi:hypothetical protein